MTSAPGQGGLAVAPTPPGRLGQAAGADLLLPYLADLRAWVDQRKRELDGLDAAALRSSEPDSYTGDITLSMALWQSVSDRCQTLERLWDSGRADVAAREHMSQVIWGRLEGATSALTGSGIGSAAGGGLALSVVEACRLSDALAAALRARLSFDPQASEASVRVAALRGALERLRELVKQEPSWSPQVELLATRVDDVATRAARGGDVDSTLHQLEADAAGAERDLIVTTASKLKNARDAERAVAELAADRVRATNEVAALERREEHLRDLVARCVAHVVRAPRLAVPDAEALGPVPDDRAGVDAFLARLANVVRAMDVVEAAYSAPLRDLEDLGGLLDAYRVLASRTGRDADPAVAAAATTAHDLVRARPADLDAARAAVNAFQALVNGRPS